MPAGPTVILDYQNPNSRRGTPPRTRPKRNSPHSTATLRFLPARSLLKKLYPCRSAELQPYDTAVPAIFL
jgi:hypothetical protein